MRGMEKAVIRGTVFLGALLGASTVFAAAGITSSSVTALSDQVTYSSAASGKAKALNTYIGYQANVTNTSGNTINNVYWEGTITLADLQESPTFSSAEGVTCGVVGNPTGSAANAVTIRCPIGQLKAGVSTPDFAVFFLAPIQDSVSPLPLGSDTVTFSGRIITAEGPDAGNSPNDSVDFWGPAQVLTLGTTNATNVKSAVPKSGGQFFTGTGGLSLAADPFATTVTVPALPSFTTATIDEGTATGCVSANLGSCYTSQITIPGTFSPYLTIMLRVDAANIVKGTKITSVVIQYNDGTTTYPVGDCANSTTPRSDGIPCVAMRTYYKNRGTTGWNGQPWTSDLDGDFEFVLLNIRNGGYKVF